MSYFKFLERGAIGPLTGFAWRAGVWVVADGPLASCGNGAHVLRPRNLAHWIHEELWRADVDGEIIEGGDCVVARRVRLTERVEGWQGGDGARFAQACFDRIMAAAAQATEPALRKHFGNYERAMKYHVEKKNAAMAGYVSALGIAQVATDGAPADCFRRERDWQSEWLSLALSNAA